MTTNLHLWKGCVMTVNMGPIDRIIRVIAGLALIAFALHFIFPSTGWNWIGWIGVVPLATALFGNCPLYTALGVATCARKSPAH
jgi:hypothetical protein